jgi:hypothetical protein
MGQARQDPTIAAVGGPFCQKGSRSINQTGFCLHLVWENSFFRCKYESKLNR